jgi:Tol biopolymer transport system component
MKLPKRPSVGLLGGVIALNALLLFGAVDLGLRVPGTRILSALPEMSLLDYSAPPGGNISPLSNAFIRSVLGGTGSPALGQASNLGGRSGVSGTPDPGGSEPVAPPIDGAAKGVSITHGLINDAFADAIDVPALPFTAHTNTAKASREPGDPSGCSPVGGTVWYRLSPDRARGLVVNTFGSDHATALGVFSGSTLSGLQSVGCDRDPQGDASVGFAAEKGTTYFFQVTGPLGGGNLTFALEAAGVTTLVSRSSSGQEANQQTFDPPSVSGNGRYVAFASWASDLVPGDTNQTPDAFVRDLVTGTTTRVSVSSSGEQGAGVTSIPTMSRDGRYVTFTSTSLLVPGMHRVVCGNDAAVAGSAGCYNVYIHDMRTRQTRLVSVSSSGSQTGSEATGSGSTVSSISANDRYVAFSSTSPDLVPHDTNATFQNENAQGYDIFVRDLRAGTTRRVSVSTRGAQANGDSKNPVISGDGRYVLFASAASNLVPHDTNDTSGVQGDWDVFVHDLRTGRTTRVSVSRSGNQGDESSGYVSGFPQCKTQGCATFPLLGISAHGRYAAFASDATNLVPHDTNGASDVFVRDMRTGRIIRISVSSDGRQANGGSAWSPMSADGRYVAFYSDASNLVPGDTQACSDTNPNIGTPLFAQPETCADVFVRDLRTGITTRVSVSSAGKQGDAGSYRPAISADGRVVVFVSQATDLARGDQNGWIDVFSHRMPREA